MPTRTSSHLGRESRESKSIWILDDDSELCDLLSIRFQQHGWLSRAFHEPFSMLHSLEEEVPDLLIVDQLLPSKTGSEVIAEIRSQGYSLPILILSALGAPKQRVSGLESGADDYLGKPFLFRELHLRAEKLLQRGASKEQITSHEPSQVDDQRGISYLLGRRWKIGTAILDANNQRLQGSLGMASLSRGDMALLALLCRHQQKIVSRNELVRASGSLVDATSSRSIDVRMSRLRRAFKSASGEVNIIESIRGEGYRLRPEVKPVEP